jgi:hypothetical protein
MPPVEGTVSARANAVQEPKRASECLVALVSGRSRGSEALPPASKREKRTGGIASGPSSGGLWRDLGHFLWT